jgi:cell wall-associated NlpC family hydrolase
MVSRSLAAIAALLLALMAPPAPAIAQRPAAAELVLSALGLLGVPYRHGGVDPSSGLDCSGLVQFVARSALGVPLPRPSEAMSREGLVVGRGELQPGDLVFFNTLGRPFSHVGIYVGDGQFVHSPARRGQVRIEQIGTPYWRARFDGGRRLQQIAAEQGAVPGGPPASADPYGLAKP